MTCIVGLISEKKGGKVIHIGGDSIGSNSSHVSHRKDGKVFRRNAHGQEFLFGFTSSYRMGQLIRYKLKIPKYTGGDLFKYMVSSFVEELRKCLKDHGYSRVDSNEEHGGTFLVAFRGRLFEIGNDYQVAEHVDTYNAVGSGYAYALGSLYSSHHVETEEERIKMALDAASYFTPSVGGSYDIQKTIFKEK